MAEDSNVIQRECRLEAPSFKASLEQHGLVLTRQETLTLQVNVGLLCNQTCRHCHLDAGPGRRELMSPDTMDAVIAYTERCRFSCIDITGGAPELLPGLPALLEGLAPATPRLMLRSNLTAGSGKRKEHLMDLCRRLGVIVIASFPSTSENQTDSQRGKGTWKRSIATLKELNRMGYGQEGSGLELNLVANPAGAFLPPDQCRVESKFKKDLGRRWGIVFNSMFTFANAPLGRYRQWLLQSGNYDSYIRKIADSFNPETVQGLMCRTLASVSWDGYLYDCDFNQAAGLPLGKGKSHLSELKGPPAPGSLIAVGDHCFACTAGAGFT